MESRTCTMSVSFLIIDKFLNNESNLTDSQNSFSWVIHHPFSQLLTVTIRETVWQYEEPNPLTSISV